LSQLIEKVRAFCMRSADEIQSDIISFDGNESQRRQANHCFGAFLDCSQRKFVDFACALDSFGRVKKSSGNCGGATKGMETFILQQLIDQWKGNLCP
jgi:hypothetical protein